MKYGMLIHINHSNLMGDQKSENPRWQMVAILKNQKIVKSRKLFGRFG